MTPSIPPLNFKAQHFLPLATVLLLTGCSSNFSENTHADVAITITSQVSPEFQAIDTLHTVSLAQEKFIVFMNWSNIPLQRKYLFFTQGPPITYTLSIYDESGKQVNHDIHTLTPSRAEEITLGLHEFNPEDTPGVWTIRLEHSGETIEKPLTIEP